MTTPTSAVTINTAFLLEIKEDNTELEDLLTESRAAAADIATRTSGWQQFVELLWHLRDNVAMHFVLEEAYGYFDNPSSDTTELGPDTASVRAQHETLYAELCSIVDHAEQRLYGERPHVPARQIAQELIAFCDHLLEHDVQEHALILEIQKCHSTILATESTNPRDAHRLQPCERDGSV